MTREEKKELKRWLTGLIPEGMSRNDVADTLDVSRKTISTMLNPEATNFANGLTMLRYLQLAGAVNEVPGVSPAASRLAALEARVAESVTLTKEAIQLLREARPQATGDPPTQNPKTGTDG